jgi:protease I
MKPVTVIAVILVVLSTVLPPAAAAEDVEALLLLSNNYGANLHLNRDNMKKHGWNITLAGINQTITPCPLYAGPLGCPVLTVDILVSEIQDISEYDVLAIMPVSWRSGNPHNDLLNNQEALDLVKAASDSGLVIFATCAGPRVLAAADVLNGVRMQGRVEYRSEYEAAGAIYVGQELYPITDGKIITASRGDYYQRENFNAILAALVDNTK